MSSNRLPKKRKREIFASNSAVTVVQLMNGRRIVKGPLATYSTSQSQGESSTMIDPIAQDSSDAPENEIMEDSQNAPRRKTKTQDDMLHEWKEKEKEYMEVLLDFESIGGALACSKCSNASDSLFRCLTCSGRDNYCQHCIVSCHRGTPFHRIMRWNNDSGCFVAGDTLGSLGLLVSLGHESHSSICPHPGSVRNLTVVHSNGLHDIPVQFCGCPNSTSMDLQIFAYRLFPSTTHTPQTAFSFEVLEQFRFQHLEGKTSVYTYMNVLLRLTDDANQFEVEDRTREFRRVFRQWSYLKASQLVGRYDSGFEDVPMAISCPACPQPGKNIEKEWKCLLPARDHWLHRQFIHFDANFRLTLEKRSNRSPSSTTLWNSSGYFANTQEYQNYLSSISSLRQEASECVDHKALSQAPRRRFENLEVSGIAGAVCRHECALPQSFVNLSQGERYINSDYGLSTAMRSMNDLKEIVLSYDIACQYSRNFMTRFTGSPHLELPKCSIIFSIPKFHLPAHKEDCRYFYSLNYLKHVGRTDGEAIERFWSPHNHLSGSTSRMSPENRLDTLNSHFADWNWRKLCNMSKTLLLRLKDSQTQVVLHSAKYADIHASVDESDTHRWISLEENYVPSLGTRTIYQLAADNAPSQIAILRELSQSRDPTNARQDSVAVDTPAISIWINEGLELEDSQRSLRVHASTIDAGSTEREHVLLNRKRTSLYHRLMTWRRSSPLGEDDIGDSDDDSDEDDVQFEDMQIPLPSNLPNVRLVLLAHLSQIEQKLRFGQAYDALKQLRRALALRLAMKRQSQNARGQHENLRSRAALKRVDGDIDLIAARYKAAHSALSRMHALEAYPELKDLIHSDLATSNVFEPSRPLGRGYENARVSWIWTVRGAESEMRDDNWLKEVLRVQFLDAKINLDRWKEEEQLLKMEIRRTADYFRWMVGTWGYRAEHGHTAGFRAHASSMRLIYGNLEKEIRSTIAL